MFQFGSFDRGGTQNSPIWVLFQRKDAKYPCLGLFSEEGSKISWHGSFSRGWTQNVLVWVLPEERNRMSQFGSFARGGTQNVSNLCPSPEVGPKMS